MVLEAIKTKMMERRKDEWKKKTKGWWMDLKEEMTKGPEKKQKVRTGVETMQEEMMETRKGREVKTKIKEINKNRGNQGWKQ